MATATLSRGANTDRATLLLNITINGLDYDMVTSLMPHFSDGGFRMLAQKGVTITDVDFGGSVDDTAAAAIIATGASPAVNGITSAELYDPQSRTSRPIVYDQQWIGNFTDETFSPRAIRVSTLADEVRMDAGGLGNVHALAPDAAQAIVSAGHASNSACWITDVSGKWATSTWYKDLPTPMQEGNRRRPLSVRLDTLTWTPQLPDGAIAHLPSYKKIYPFRHAFLHSDPNRYRAFKTSAPVNAEIADMAIDYLTIMNLGRREPIDMLSLTFTLQPYLYGRDADNRAETIDAYLKLDRQLQRLLQHIDANGPGLAHTLVVVAGTPTSAERIPADEKWGIPTGEFSPQRAVSLLNMNLMTIYGNGEWVSGIHNGQVYLNRQLIHDRGLRLRDVAIESADFLRKMSGVAYAATLTDIIDGDTVDGMFPPMRNIDVDTCGDLFIALVPGWTMGANGGKPATTYSMSPSTSSVMILASGVEPRTISTTIDARAIAPTISRLLKIKAPNGALLPSLRL